MARIRTIKPEFWTDEKVVELDAWTRLLFIGLWNFADDSGRMVASEKRIRMQIFPADTVDIRRGLDELSAACLIELYVIDGIEYLQVCHFAKHQKIDRRTRSKLPDKNGRLDENSPNPPDGREKEKEKEKEKEGREHQPASKTQPAEPPADAAPLPIRLPPHWRPGQQSQDFAKAEHPDWTPERLERVLADFRDHWISKGERRADWDAAWRKWVRAERKPETPQAAATPIPAAQSTEKARQALQEAAQAGGGE